jgi:glutathione synthase/RimK-type ligase-like ATP-grasp enzyme
VALATSAAYADLAPDDRLLLAPLAERGVRAEPAVWDDPAVRWTDYDAVVVRSCWDYHRRFAEFAAWVDRLTNEGVPLWNPPAALRWNARKTYLRDLAAAGVPTVPTRWADAATRASLAELLDAEGWADAVVKPVVSASAFGTWRVSAREAPDREDEFRAALAHGEVMVQRFVERVATHGEWSLVFFDGAFSHAALKRPRAGDFRVQQELGGSAVAADPTTAVVVQAALIVGHFAAGSLYARVDGVVDDDTLCVMELELVEPSLFLGLDPGAPARFARAIARRTGA